MVKYVISIDVGKEKYDLLMLIIEHLKTPLEKLLNATEAKGHGTNKQVAIIHKSYFEVNAERKVVITAAVCKYDLVLLLVQGFGYPDKITDGPGEQCWRCGTEFLIDHFDHLDRYLNESDPANWAFDGWAPKWPEHLVAWYLLQCAIKQKVEINVSDFTELKNNAENQFNTWAQPHPKVNKKFTPENMRTLLHAIGGSMSS